MNLGAHKEGRIIVEDCNKNDLGRDVFYSSCKNPEQEHLERRSKLENLRKNLTQEETKKIFEKLFYSIPKFI